MRRRSLPEGEETKCETGGGGTQGVALHLARDFPPPPADGNCAVVVTNQIQSNPTAFFGDPNRPAGGNVVAHASTHRLYIRKGKANTRVIHVIDSPYLPEARTRFAITEKGVEDAEEK